MFNKKKYLKEVDSTNNYVEKIIENNPQIPNFAVISSNQTAGKGLLTNKWESEKGKNILFSLFVTHTNIQASEQFIISIITSLSVLELIGKYCSEVKIKWPNDIYVRNKKICGILIKHNTSSSLIKNSIIGIGININQTVFPSTVPNPTSLKILTEKDFKLNIVFNDFLTIFQKNYSKGISNPRELWQEYTKNLFQISIQARYKSQNTEFIGEILGVNNFGQLIIEDSDKNTRTFNLKEVEFVL